jgi:GT2 family glycosyltransferase
MEQNPPMRSNTQHRNVFAVIVNWNGKSDTVTCLDSLKRVIRNGVTFNVIVVDNGSSDDSVAVIRKEHPWVTVIPTGRNLGFTGGNNTGITYAMKHGADIVWLLNNDTIVDPHIFSCLEAFHDPGVGACGNKIYFAKGHEFHAGRYSASEKGKVIWYSGGLIDWDNMYASHRGVDEVDHGQYDRVEETPFITGCSIFIRSSVITQVGMLDDRYYLYLEDLDWCLRMKRAGWRIVYFPRATLWHVNAGSSGRPGNPLHEYYFTRNRLLIGFRYAPLRTKLALFREGIHFVFGPSRIRRRAVLDAFLFKFGKQYEPKAAV